MAETRSDFVIHWTGGRDIDRDHGGNDARRREAYVERLRKTLLGDPAHHPPGDADKAEKDRTQLPGLWMNYLDEELVGLKDVTLDPVIYPTTCFSEIHLSRVREHTTGYGCLGFGFSRDFIIDRRGGPVMYVSGNPTRDATVANIKKALVVLEHMTNDAARRQNLDQPDEGFKPCAALRSLEAALGDAAEPRETLRQLVLWINANRVTRVYSSVQTDWKEDELLRRCWQALQLVPAFMKHMSKCADRGDMTFLREHEWRIVATEHAECDRLLTRTQFQPLQDPDQRPAFKIPFTPCHLRVLIFPDDDTRQDAMNDPQIRGWFKTGGLYRFPIMATVAECDQF